MQYLNYWVGSKKERCLCQIRNIRGGWCYTEPKAAFTSYSYQLLVSEKSTSIWSDEFMYILTFKISWRSRISAFADIVLLFSVFYLPITFTCFLIVLTWTLTRQPHLYVHMFEQWNSNIRQPQQTELYFYIRCHYSKQTLKYSQFQAKKEQR